MKENKPYDSSLVGFIYGIAAYVLWGFLPLYWKLLDKIPATEILAHRILWSFMFVCTILYFNGNLLKCKEVFKDKLNIVRISCATVFITINWGTYIWAVNSDHIVEASMGYYMNPLIVVVLGVVILKERLNTWQIVSLIMATIGVGIVTISYGQIPWISLILALSFGLYGLMKKMIPVGSTVSLALETAILMPLTLIYIIFRQVSGIGALGNISAATTFILIGTGIATALPLLWFSEGARRIPLSSIGFLQYISPTISLVLGIFVFGEQFTQTHIISFGFIWGGLIIYSISQVKQMRKKNELLRESIEVNG
jgi:chloramphenicol-sensitive protein RarD